MPLVSRAGAAAVHRERIPVRAVTPLKGAPRPLDHARVIAVTAVGSRAQEIRPPLPLGAAVALEKGIPVRRTAVARCRARMCTRCPAYAARRPLAPARARPTARAQGSAPRGLFPDRAASAERHGGNRRAAAVDPRCEAVPGPIDAGAGRILRRAKLVATLRRCAACRRRGREAHQATRMHNIACAG